MEADAEQRIFEGLAADIRRVQDTLEEMSGAPAILRAFHAKLLLGVTNARLHVLPGIPERFRIGPFQPGAELPATVQLSNASGVKQADSRRDMRGAAVRIKVSDRESQDLLMTNFPVSHARNARQFVASAVALAGSKLMLLPRLIMSVGLAETIRMLRNLSQATGRPVASLALETYWSRGAILWGDAGPVRYLVRPAAGTPTVPVPANPSPDYLRHEIASRLEQGDIAFELCLQPYVDEQRTPIEDASVEWLESVSPPVPIATLTLPRQRVISNDPEINRLAFSPWIASATFRPLGNLQRARLAVYRASAEHRGAGA